MTFAEATLNFKPDTSWVPEELSLLIGGVLGVCCLVIPVVLAVGAVRFVFTRATGPVWDNAVGDRILVGVLVAAIALGSLAQLAGWGLGVFGAEGTSVPVTASAQDGTGDMVSDSWHATLGSQLSKGDIGGAMGTIGDRIDWDSIPGGDLLEQGWNAASGVVGTVDKILSGDWSGAAGDVINGVGGAIGWVGDKLGDAAGWVGDKLGDAAEWFKGLFG